MDGLVISSPYSAGISAISKVCSQYGKENYILFNLKKSSIGILKSKYEVNKKIKK